MGSSLPSGPGLKWGGRLYCFGAELRLPRPFELEDFIEGSGITRNKLAVSIGVPPRRINEIVHGTQGITADTALRLAKYFGTSAELWIKLQSYYELDRYRTPRGSRSRLSPR